MNINDRVEYIGKHGTITGPAERIAGMRAFTVAFDDGSRADCESCELRPLLTFVARRGGNTMRGIEAADPDAARTIFRRQTGIFGARVAIETPEMVAYLESTLGRGAAN